MGKLFYKSKLLFTFGLSWLLISVSIHSLNKSTTAVAPPIAQIDQTITYPSFFTTITSNADGTVVQHQGVNGETVLSVLRSGAEVMIDQSNVDRTVLAINGVIREESQRWALYVNGQPLSHSAISYVADDDDQIEWRLEG